MTGPKGKSHGRFVKDEEQESEDGTKDATNLEEEKTSRGSSATGWMTTAGRDDSLAGLGQHNTATTAPQPKGAAAVVPAAGAGSIPEEHIKIEDQHTLREQLQALVSHKLRTLGNDLDPAGLAALEALNKLPAARGQPSASGDSGGGGGGGKKKILPLGLEKINKFSGKDPQYLTDCLNQFYSLVVAALPASSPSAVNRALTRDVVFVLEGSAIKFFNALKAGRVEWEPTPPLPNEGAPGGTLSHQQQPQQQQQQEDGRGGGRFRPPSAWTELYEAFHDHYLPVTGIARTSEKLFSSTQAPDESVLSLAQRQLGLATHLHRLIEANGKQIDFMEAISVRLFERALRADLRRIQEAEPPCSSFQESVDRAERNATKLTKKPDKPAVTEEHHGGSCAISGSVAAPAARSAVASSEGGGGSGSGDGGVFSRELPKHTNKFDHDSSERDGREERSGTTASQGRNAVGAGRDAGQGRNAVGSGRGAGQEAGGIFPRGASRSASTWQEPDGGEGGGPAQRHKKERKGQKRTREWREMHQDGGADQPFPPPQPFQRAWPVDPGASRPCTVTGCKTINRNFHSSNECFYHPIHGEHNKARGIFGRKKGFRRSQPDFRGPQHNNGGFGGGDFRGPQHHNDGFGGNFY